MVRSNRLNSLLRDRLAAELSSDSTLFAYLSRLGDSRVADLGQPSQEFIPLFEKLRDDSNIDLLIDLLLITSNDCLAFFEAELPHLIRELDHEASSNVKVLGPGFGGGRINWGRTLSGRAAHRVTHDKFYVSKVTKSYDIASNRLLKLVLLETARTLSRIKIAYPFGLLFDRLLLIEKQISHALASPYLKACEATSTYSATSILHTLRSRKPRYKALARIATCRRATDSARSKRDWTMLVTFLQPNSFIPINDDHLFEVYSLARTLQAIESTSARLISLSLITADREGEIALFEHKGRRIRVYFDNAPATGFWSHSKYKDLVNAYPTIAFRPKRPDILVISDGAGMSQRLLLLECKNSTESTYIATGIYKVFSYLKDLEGSGKVGNTAQGILLVHSQAITPVLCVDVAVANPESDLFLSFVSDLLTIKSSN